MNAERKENRDHHAPGGAPDKGGHPGACEKRKQDRHRLTVPLRPGKGDRAGGGSGQGASELKAQGRNLNQLTTLANMGKVTVVYGDRLAESYGQVSEQLRQLLREVN